jgi:hypothetical protein
MLNIPLPRLLPTTIAITATVLGIKFVTLGQAVLTGAARPERIMLASANAAGAERMKEAPKPVPAQPKGEAKPAHGEAKPAHGAPAKPAPAAAQTPPPAPPQPVDPPISESEKALLQELRQRRTELEARADAVTARESVLAAAEQKLGSRVGELQALQKRLEYLDAARKQKEDAGWQGLVKMYEAMKPKEAATIFNELSMPVLLQVLDRMKDAKAAAVLAAMSPDKARDVTAELAQLRTGKDPAAKTAGG